MSEVLAAAVGIGLFALAIGVPVWLTGRGFRAVIRRRVLLADALGERGSVHQFDMPLTLGVVLFGAGAVFAGINLLPLVVWLADGDLEARRVFLSFWGVIGFFVGCAWLAARPGLRLLVAEPDRLTAHRTGLRHRLPPAGTERSIEHTDITGFHERRSVLGSLEVRGDGPVRQLRINPQTTGFDELVASLRRAAPAAPYTNHRAPDAAERSDAPTPMSWGVPPRQTRLLIGFLGALLLFFWIWPWLLVTGDHPTRDAIIFTALGTGLWLVIALLVGQENFQRRQPAQLDLRPGRIAWRVFRGGWTERPITDVVTATVETDIIYVRGFPGYRHPLRIRFVDGEELLVDDARARHLRTSTVQLGATIRAHVRDLSARTPDDEERARAADDSAEGADDREAARLRGVAVALWPDASRLAGLGDIGDLHRRAGDHALAISLYRSHLDVDSGDADAWQGLAASLRAKGRDDLAGEAVAQAERILLGGST